MPELKNFYNGGFGWICKYCEREQKTVADPDNRSRLMREGEGEYRLSNQALARWTDQSRQILQCPNCDRTEPVGRNKSKKWQK